MSKYMPPKGAKRGPYKKRNARVVSKSSPAQAGYNAFKKHYKPSKGISDGSSFGAMNQWDPIPQKMFIKMRYADRQIYTAGVGGICGAEQVYRLNSVNDPDFTGTGRRAYGWTTMSSLYNRYKVHSVDIIIKATDPSEDGMFLVGMVQAPANAYQTTGKTGAQISETSGSFYKQVNNTGSQQATIKKHFKIQGISGLTKIQFKADVASFTATSTGNPANTPWLRINAGSARNATGGTIIIQTELIYHIQWYDRQTPAVETGGT